MTCPRICQLLLLLSFFFFFFFLTFIDWRLGACMCGQRQRRRWAGEPAGPGQLEEEQEEEEEEKRRQPPGSQDSSSGDLYVLGKESVSE